MKLRLPSSLRFRLRTLFVLLTLLAVGLGYVGYQYQIVRERREVARWLDEVIEETLLYDVGKGTGIVIEDMTEPAFLRRALGDAKLGLIFGHGELSDRDLVRLRRVFPQSQVTTNSD